MSETTPALPPVPETALPPLAEMTPTFRVLVPEIRVILPAFFPTPELTPPASVSKFPAIMLPLVVMAMAPPSLSIFPLVPMVNPAESNATVLAVAVKDFAVKFPSTLMVFTLETTKSPRGKLPPVTPRKYRLPTVPLSVVRLRLLPLLFRVPTKVMMLPAGLASEVSKLVFAVNSVAPVKMIARSRVLMEPGRLMVFPVTSSSPMVLVLPPTIPPKVTTPPVLASVPAATVRALWLALSTVLLKLTLPPTVPALLVEIVTVSTVPRLTGPVKVAF